MSLSDNKQKLLFWFLVISFITIGYNLGFHILQTEFTQILISYSLLFGIYILFLKYFSISKFSTLLALGIACRGLLIFSVPGLSDDIYRFLWDGFLSGQGVNPMQYLPSAIMDKGILPSTYLDELYPLLNSPNYFTVYPPFAQLTFLISSVFAKSIAGQIICIKIILFSFELGNIWVIHKLLKVLSLQGNKVLIYILNPLVIMEIMGNTHYEGVLLFFLLYAIWLGLRKGVVYSGLSMASSIASKLTTLMYLPLWIKFGGFKKAMIFYIVVGLGLIIYFLPFINFQDISNFSDSLNLYFQSFEFNGSLYYLARWIGYQYRGFNMIADIGPLLSGLTFLAIMYLAYRQRFGDTRQLFLHIMLASTIYLVCATTVHPWYIIIPLAISIFTKFKFAILWSFLAVLSYSHYAFGIVHEKFGWLWLEYGVLFTFIFLELYFQKRRNLGSRISNL